MNSTGSVSNIDFANPPSTARESTQDLASTVSQIFHKAATALSTVDHTLFETGLAEVVRNAATKLGSIFKEAVKALPLTRATLQPRSINSVLPGVKMSMGKEVALKTVSVLVVGMGKLTPRTRRELELGILSDQIRGSVNER